MPFTTWIRDLFGIRKDVIDTKKAKLEIEKLEEEKRARNLITPATLDDVKRYDPKYRMIKRKMKRRAKFPPTSTDMYSHYYLSGWGIFLRFAWLLGIGLVVGLLIGLLLISFRLHWW